MWAPTSKALNGKLGGFFVVVSFVLRLWVIKAAEAKTYALPRIVDSMLYRSLLCHSSNYCTSTLVVLVTQSK